MTSLRLYEWSVVVGLLATIGCGGSSSGSGAGGALGRGGSSSAGGIAGTGGMVGLGGNTTGIDAGGSGGPSDARNDVVAPGDASVDAPAPTGDASADAPGIGVDAGATLTQVAALLTSRCAGCHTGAGSAATRIDLSEHPDAGSTLYARLLGPVLLETFCGENIDAGGDAAEPRRAVIPGHPESSFLYQKITGTQPSPGNPPANCGVRMPRVFVAGVDGGAATFPACDSLDGGAANCLTPADIDLIRRWILEGAAE
jgi:hypothetical protein